MTVESPGALPRRRLNALAVGTAATLAVGPAANAVADEPTRLSVITAAAYKKSFDRYIVPKMKAMYNVEVVSSPFLSAEALSRALAQRSDPHVSVFSMDQGPWQEGKAAGLWATLGQDVANLRDLPAAYQDPDRKGAVMELSLLGMLYDKDAFAARKLPVPQSIYDMWKPEFRDAVALEQFSSSYAFALLAYVNELQGGDDSKSFDAGFAKLKELRPNVRSFIGQAAQIAQLFQQKEILIAWGGLFSAMQAAGAGLPIAWTAPKEGAVASAHIVAIAKGSPNQKNAEQLVNLMLSPEFEALMAETDFQVPVNTRTRLSPAFAKTFPASAATVAEAKPIPWAEYIRLRVPLAERWQREIEQ